MDNLSKLLVLITFLLSLQSCTPEALDVQEPRFQLEDPDVYMEDSSEEEVPVDKKG